MSKIYEALKQAEQERSSSQRDTLSQLADRVAAEREILTAAIEECQEQLARLANQPQQLAAVVERLDGMAAAADVAALSAEIGVLEAGLERTNDRIDRTTETISASVGKLYTRLDEVSTGSDSGLAALRSDLGAARQQVADALRDWGERLAQLAHAVQSSQEDQQRMLAELRQALASMESLNAGSRSALHEAAEHAARQGAEALRQVAELGARFNHDGASQAGPENVPSELRDLLHGCAARVEETRADLDAVRASFAGAAEEFARYRVQCEERFAEQRAQSAPAVEATRLVEQLRDEVQVAQRELVGRVAAGAQARSEADRRLREELRAVQTAVAAVQPVNTELAELRTRIAALAGDQVRVTALAADVARTQTTADAAVRRAAAVGEAQERSISTLREELLSLTDEVAALSAGGMHAGAAPAPELKLRGAAAGGKLEAQFSLLRRSIRDLEARLNKRLDDRVAAVRAIVEETTSAGAPQGAAAAKDERPPALDPARSVSQPSALRRPSAPRRRSRWRPAAAVAFVGMIALGAAVVLRSAYGGKAQSSPSGLAASIAGLDDPVLEQRFRSGLTALQRRDFAVAERAFREVIAVRPGCVEARNNLAVVLDEEQQRSAALDQLREALRLRPDYERARKNLEVLEGVRGARSEWRDVMREPQARR